MCTQRRVQPAWERAVNQVSQSHDWQLCTWRRTWRTEERIQFPLLASSSRPEIEIQRLTPLNPPVSAKDSISALHYNNYTIRVILVAVQRLCLYLEDHLNYKFTHLFSFRPFRNLLLHFGGGFLRTFNFLFFLTFFTHFNRFYRKMLSSSGTITTTWRFKWTTRQSCDSLPSSTRFSTARV